MKASPGRLKNPAGKGILKNRSGKDVFWLLFQKFQQFMYGRYGGDTFSLVLLVIALVLSLIGGLFFWPVTLLADVVYIYVLFRMFSKNIPARQREYYAFLKVWEPVKKWFRFQKQKFDQRGTYRYFKCPNCKQQLRAPRGRGKIEVTCQKCHTVFRTKT